MSQIDKIISGCRGEEEDYYKLLGCSENSTDIQILAEFRLLALKYHPDKNPNDVEALQEFQKLKEARDVLGDPERKAIYDKWRRSEINISFKQWQNLGTRCQTTMHWAKPKSQTMLENTPDGTSTTFQENGNSINHDDYVKQNSSRNASWESESNRVYGKFRRYEI